VNIKPKSVEWYAMSLRDGKIIQRYKSGWSTKRLARVAGLSDQRIRQILKDNDVDTSWTRNDK